jgi:FkbM family methyltransferase
VLIGFSNFDGDLLLDVKPTDTIGGALWHIPQLYERLERKVFCNAIRPGCTVLDVGANVGMYSLFAAKRGAQVFAIEADQEKAAMLRHHVELNRQGSRVQIVEMAASDRPGRVSLRRISNNCGGSIVVPGADVLADTIDSLGLPPIDVCKMDVEGSEERALHGMSETLRHSRPQGDSVREQMNVVRKVGIDKS